MPIPVVTLAVALSSTFVLGAESSVPPLPVRGLAARMIDDAGLGLAGSAIPECIRERPIDEPADAVGANSVIAPIDAYAMPAACFDAKFPPSWEVQQMVNAAIQQSLDRYQLNPRWPGATGTPLTLTWSLVPDGLSITSGIGEPAANSNLFAQMDAKFGGIANRATWIAQIQACFDRWALLTGTSYTRVTFGGNPWDDGAAWGTVGAAGARGDVRISMKNIDGVNGVLAYNYFPTGGGSPGDMVLDASESWGSGGPVYVFLRNTVCHEHGHGIGLQHVCPVANTKLMEPFLSMVFDGPQHDDIRGADRHYGDALEPNNSAGAASPAGALSVGGTLNPSAIPAPGVPNGSLTAISLDGDLDWFSFTTAAPIIGTITVQPLGTTYADFTQTTNCNEPSPTTNSLTQADLTLQFYDATGTTLIAQAAAGGAGVTETLGNILLSPPGTLLVRVSENGAPTQAQLYTLTITGNSTPTITASDNAFADRVQLNWTAITGAVTYNLFRGTTNVRGSASALGSSATNSFADTTAVPGTTYFYWVEADTGAGGSRPVAGPDSGVRQVSAPANDACAAAIAVTSGSVTAGTLQGATNDAALGACGNATANPDVWYSFTAACAGDLTVSTCGSNDAGGIDTNIDTVVSIVSACGGSELACNDDAPASPAPNCGGLDASSRRDSYITQALTAGQSVLIRVSRFGASTGVAFTLRANFSIANDLCANAAPIATAVATPFCNTNADTDGPAEASCTNAGDSQINGDLWYLWTAPTGGRFTASICSNGFDTRVGIYPGTCPAAAGTILACNDDFCGAGGLGSQASAVGATGSAYRIRVGGFALARGNATLTIFCAPDINLSGAVSVQDIFDFFELYFAGDLRADFNGSGTISVQDIFDFLEAYFSGC